MPLDEKELLERDAKRNIGEELLQAVRDIKAGKVGRVSTLEVSPIAAARQKIGLSQSEFAKCLAYRSALFRSGSKGAEPHPVRQSPSSLLPSRNRRLLKNCSLRKHPSSVVF